MSIHRLVGTQAHQAARISAGVQDGSLTKAEAKQLAGQQAQNSKDIFQSRHDDQTRPAPTDRPRVDRQQNQAARIRDGVQDGSLTKGETTRLAKAEARTDLYLAKSKLDDGKIGPHESAVIDRRQDATSKAIFAAKHNDRVQQG